MLNCFTQSAPIVTPIGGGEMYFSEQDRCLSEENRIDIKRRLAVNKEQLMTKGKLHTSITRKQTGSFIYPLRKTIDNPFNNFYTLVNYVDHDETFTGSQFGDSNLDYNCGNRTYDTETGYNHSGIDYTLWPFPWFMFDNALVEVIAGDAGIIIGKDDGNKDDNCSCNGTWNAIYIQHADGSTAWYGHLKKNSLSTKEIGETVTKGEYLGVVGSSGCSTSPHLHLEMYDADGNLVDPYAGDCNDFNEESLWEDQPEYRVSKVNALMTHDAEPVHSCPSANEKANVSNEFDFGQDIYCAIYLKDQIQGQVNNFTLRDPNGEIWTTWSFESPDTYSASWWYWIYRIPDLQERGFWTFEVMHQGQTIEHEFLVVDATVSATDEINKAQFEVFPNPTSDVIQIKSESSDIAKVSLYNTLGVNIAVFDGINAIQLGNQSAGIYFIKAFDAKGYSLGIKKVFVNP